MEPRNSNPVARLWRTKSVLLPIGGLFSAQAVDLHNLWCFHLYKQRFHGLGKMLFTDAGYPIWVNTAGRVLALAQYCDNVLVAAKGTGSTWAMHDVCAILQNIWSLRVPCPCITNDTPVCHLTCMPGDLFALGVSMERLGGHGQVTVHP